MRIPSITFQANTADYVNVDPDKAAKNASTLARLAEIFKKYAKYKIQVEGHANLVNLDNPGQGKDRAGAGAAPPVARSGRTPFAMR